MNEIEYQVPVLGYWERRGLVTQADERAEGTRWSCKMLVGREWYLIPRTRWRSHVSTLKSRMYPLNLVLYPLLLYLHTYYIHLLMYQLPYVRTYCTYCAHTYHTYLCAVCTTYCYPYKLHCRCRYVYILKKRYYGRVDRYLLHLHCASTHCT